MSMRPKISREADVAQSVERTTLNRVVVGSIPTVGVLPFFTVDFNAPSSLIIIFWCF